jgi:O-antigen ligase
MLTIALAFLGARYIGATGMPAFMNLVNMALAGALGLAVLMKPHIGLVFLVATLPLTALLPSLPLVSGLAIPLGATTIAGYVIQHRWGRERATFRLQWIHILAALFVIWLFVSNPSAAVFRGDRNWLLTFGQLGILLWLTGMLLQPSSRQRQVLFFFVLAATISAIYAIYDSPVWQQTGIALREQRSGGLAGINAGARYFVVALVALYYLYTTSRQRFLRIAGVAAMFMLFMGVIATGSRTGLLLLPIALAFIVIGRHTQCMLGRLVALIAISILALSVAPQNYWQILEDMVNVTSAGIESDDIRVELWRAGLAMWRDHPFVGVGIGQFPNNLPAYALGRIPVERLSAGPHSIYVGVLAETGAIGLLLFLALCFVTLRTYWQASTRLSPRDAALAYTWFTMLLIMLVGGLTKHDQYEKLIWFLIGMATVFGVLLSQQEGTEVEAEAMPLEPGR